MSKGKDLLNELDHYEEYLGPSDMTAGDHYMVTVKRGRKKIKFDFHDNIDNDSTIERYIECLILDAEAWEDSNDSIDTFRNLFGYSEELYTAQQLRKVLSQLHGNAKRLHKIFTDEEIEILKDYYRGE